MPSILVIMVVWTVLSLPLAIILGSVFHDDKVVELVGMDGDAAVFRRADGALQRVSLVSHTSA